MDLFPSISSTNSRGWRLVGFPERSLQAQAAETLCCTRHFVLPLYWRVLGAPLRTPRPCVLRCRALRRC